MSNDYDNYVYMQTVKYASHEDEHSVWSEGQLRFINSIVHLLPENSKILDVGCGDGISLARFNELGHSAIGIDFNEEKLNVAKNKGCLVENCDMHDMSIFDDEQFDIIISSHSLEHAYNPVKVLNEFNRVLKSEGLLFVVVPFPDTADYAIEAHVGRDILGTSDPLNGKIKIVKLFKENGFSVSNIKEDYYREPEIWIFCKKNSFV